MFAPEDAVIIVDARSRCSVAIFDKDGLKTRYLLEGTGPLVVLIHGVGARLENWDGVVSRLAGEFRVLRYDLRGHGESTRLPARTRFRCSPTTSRRCSITSERTPPTSPAIRSAA